MQKSGRSISLFFGMLIGGLLAPLALLGEESDRWARLSKHFAPPKEFVNDFGSLRSPLLFASGRRVSSASDWEERRAEIRKHWTELMGPWPRVLEKPQLEIIESKRRENFTQQQVRLEIAPRQIEEAFLLVPDGKGPFPAVFIPYYEPQSSIGLGSELRDFGYQLAKRGFVTLSVGSPGGSAREPKTGEASCQPLSFLAYVAANGYHALASLPSVDPKRVGIVGHSYGGKWAMFGACLYEKFACGAWSDPGIVFDESRSNVNYWEPWYLGLDPNFNRSPGIPTEANPRTGAYKTLVERGHDLHELQALMAPRPFLVSGGSEDPPDRWQALNHCVAVNEILGWSDRVGMTNRPKHSPTEESNEQIYQFFEHFLKN